jgi:molecular chaperone GrpE
MGSHRTREEADDDKTVLNDVERLQQELSQAKDQQLRALAETENVRKRLQREKEEFVRFAAEGLILSLLPVIDSLEQALIAVDKQQDANQAVLKGVHLIHRQLHGVLQKEGVERIPTVGQPFDPHLHEAVAQVEAGDGTPDHTITEEVQVGYTMHGKVIRPAMVKVAVKPTTSQQEDSRNA